MFEMILSAISALGSAEVQNILTSAGESAIKNYKSWQDWKNLLVGTGDFFVKLENDQSAFFKDLELALSEDNMKQIAKNLSSDDGYSLKHKLYDSLMQLMNKYEIPYETAEMYTFRIICTVLEQLRKVDSEKYEHYFLSEWKDEQENLFAKLQSRIDKISKELTIYNQHHLEILSSGQMDIKLRRSTVNPSIGINFFVIDDEHFQDNFEEHVYDEIVYIKGRCREETIYCILNELWRLNEKRPIYVVKSLDSWNKLQSLNDVGNIYIPWFYADEIVAIDNNTNIFVVDESTPVFNKDVIELRPRTRDTLNKCLQEAGMDYERAYSLLNDTHGLYTQIKKQLFRGEYLRQPAWLNGISEKAKKVCLLVGRWEETEGDKLIIESLYEGKYSDFLDEIIPYSKGEDPFIYIFKRNNSTSYYLASTENIWSYLDVMTNEKIWKLFVDAIFEVLSESENLFTYDGQERLVAQFRGEKLFWSETIRKGMLQTLLIKGAYKKTEETQYVLDRIVDDLLSCVNDEKQWVYISKFWREICEISPNAVLNRIEKEITDNTGLLSLFEKQSNDFVFGRNAYIDILWGNEQFLVQNEYVWRGFRWFLNLDSKKYEYTSNSPKDTFAKVFCTWMNFSSINTADEKIKAAKIAFEIDGENAWSHLFSAIDNLGRSIFGEISSPKYREHEVSKTTTVAEMRKTQQGYLELLLEHMDFSVDHWKKILKLSEDLSDDLRNNIFDQLRYEVTQMSDEEIIEIKNDIRKLLFRHRFYASAEWARPEEVLIQYERLLNEIKATVPEYEYGYLFVNDWDYPLLHPVQYEAGGEREKNDALKVSLIKKELAVFQKKKLDISKLAHICAFENHSSLGEYLAIFWNNGYWDNDLFKKLLDAQNSGEMGLCYLDQVSKKEVVNFAEIINELQRKGCSDEILASAYRIEASRGSNTPLVSNASEKIKKEFWRIGFRCNEVNPDWIISESKKYASLDVYIGQIHQLYYEHKVDTQKLFSCFDGIEEMTHVSENQMTSYHLEQLLQTLQNAFMEDKDKCVRISRLEIFFMNLLQWKDMRCFQRIIKESPELMAQLVDVIFKHDVEENKSETFNENVLHNMYSLYEKAKFCPTEMNGEVQEEKLNEWITTYKRLLTENHQASMFEPTLGRLLSFSPKGRDGYEPCEAVRLAIEKYGNDRLISRYQSAVYNRRGIFSPSAGKKEFEMAEDFRATAEYLEPDYPKTAKIFFGLYETYKRESERERKDAENGIF